MQRKLTPKINIFGQARGGSAAFTLKHVVINKIEQRVDWHLGKTQSVSDSLSEYPGAKKDMEDLVGNKNYKPPYTKAQTIISLEQEKDIIKAERAFNARTEQEKLDTWRQEQTVFSSGKPFVTEHSDLSEERHTDIKINFIPKVVPGGTGANFSLAHSDELERTFGADHANTYLPGSTVYFGDHVKKGNKKHSESLNLMVTEEALDKFENDNKTPFNWSMMVTEEALDKFENDNKKSFKRRFQNPFKPRFRKS